MTIPSLGRPGRAVALLAALALAAPATAHAQYYFNGYFGQNKVQYSKFDFQIIQTDHFDIYFYPSEREASLDVARMAERSYARLSRILGHRFTERKIIILYASPTDFGQTNTTEVGEGTQGVTDFFRQRNVLFLQGALKETEHVLTHEMVHQFQFDVFSHGKAGANVQVIASVAPPLWFMEGMAEYLSLGPTTPETAMWLRDAVFENNLPTIEQLALDPNIFPYRFGHALWSYIGGRWGDEAVGAILNGTLSGGIDGSIKRTLGLTTEQLSQQWRDAVFKEYLPELGASEQAKQIAAVSLNEARSKGRLHIAPAISPDGSQIAFFSERDGFSVDMFLADAATGQVQRRLLKPTWSSNYETFRFLNSQASWSRDGKYLAVTGRRGKYDDIIILEPKRNKTVRRITVKIDGLTTPSWSPDGKQLVFTGYVGGYSDLFLVNSDGSGLKRLTHDQYADLHPAWSPDGRSIAFTTDRGPGTNFEVLSAGNFRIGIFDLASGETRVLNHMDVGKNINPAWGPEGKYLAFVSDRGGVSDLYLYDFAQDEIFQITHLLTGSAGFTPLSPVLSWAPDADKIAFMYYEKGGFNVYLLSNPRTLARTPWRAPAPEDTARRAVEVVTRAAPDSSQARPEVGEGGSIYRGKQGFRRADSVPKPAGDSAGAIAPEPLSIARLLDSATLALPDTSEFAFQKYRKHYTPDYVARPQIGYVRDNTGNGIYGSTAITLSDVLGNNQLAFGIAINGRINEAYATASYANLSNRINWSIGATQIPYYFAEPSTITPTSDGGFETRINTRRLLSRYVQGTGWYPLSRFRRFEGDLRVGFLDDALVSYVQKYNADGFPTQNAEYQTISRPDVFFVVPTLAYVFDNTIFGYVGPYLGTRYRVALSQSIGTWQYTQLLLDYRRYTQIKGPVVFAFRGLFYGRRGPDANQFDIFIGTPDLVRGHTSGSYQRNECTAQTSGAICIPLNRLVSQQLAIANFELRFPLLTPQMKFMPKGLPPIEGVAFFDAGLSWNQNSVVRWSVPDNDTAPINYRAPVYAWGVGARMNLYGLLILRLDWAFPLQRQPYYGNYVTLSLGPTF